MSSLAGRTLSRFKIIDELGRGGMGVVYRELVRGRGNMRLIPIRARTPRGNASSPGLVPTL